MKTFDNYELDISVAKKESKNILANMKCQKHKLKGRVSFDYDDIGTTGYIKACCKEYAQQVKAELEEAQLVDIIEIDSSTFK